MGLKEKINAIKEWDKKISQKMDARKLMPNYFEKWIFRASFILIVLMLILSFVTYGFEPVPYLKCTDEKGCFNTLYICKESDIIEPKIENGIVMTQNSECVEHPSESHKKLCESLPCDKKFLSYGEEYGTKPFVTLNTFYYIWFGAFILNHLYYWYRTGNFIYRNEGEK